MTAYFIHDGRNELGPFTIELLKQQKLTRNTPVREKNSNNWIPAVQLDELKEIVAPKKIRRPKDVLPAIRETVTDLKERKPRILYGTLLCIALISGVSFFSVNIINGTVPKELPKA